MQEEHTTDEIVKWSGDEWGDKGGGASESSLMFFNWDTEDHVHHLLPLYEDVLRPRDLYESSLNVDPLLALCFPPDLWYAFAAAVCLCVAIYACHVHPRHQKD